MISKRNPSMKETGPWKIWVHSDLQLVRPSEASTVLAAAVDDLIDLDLDLDAVWCLGDALCGGVLAPLETVAQINIQEVERLGIPAVYLLGNHEMDLKRMHDLDRYPLYEIATTREQWKVGNAEDFYFLQTLGNTLVVFMGDHFAQNGDWWTTHGTVRGDEQAYPHTTECYRELSENIARHPGPVIIASHYAFPGGQRPSSLMGHLLPLPPNVRLHLHGHAHIGDLVHNKDRPWQRVNPIHESSILQFNISALETARSPGSHSAILEIGAEGPRFLHIRCHLTRAWLETFDLREKDQILTSEIRDTHNAFSS